MSDAAGAEATVNEIRAMGRQAYPVQASVGVSADVDRMFQEVLGAVPAARHPGE